MAGDPISYAENNLGVHDVFALAKAAITRLQAAQDERSKLRSRRRSVEDEMSNVEMRIISDERAKHPDTSQASLSQHIKTVLRQDGEMEELRLQLNEVDSAIDDQDTTIKVAQADIQVYSARMTELGGYLSYLAAAKTAKTAKPATT